MFQKFDEESRKVLICAKREMQSLKHDYIGTEHVILGILSNNNCITDMLKKYGVNYENFRNKLIEIVGIGSVSNDLYLYTPLLKKIIENVVVEERDNGGEISLSNIFNGIISEGDGVGIRILLELKIDIDKLYGNVIKNVSKKKHKKSILDELGVDLNLKAKNGLIDPVIGREKEINRMIEILCRRTKNNPILIGEAGVGKTAIVEYLSKKIVEGNVPDILKNKRIISLDMASSVAGTKYRGEFEERMKKVLDELENDEDIIIFIDEIHTIMGAGGAEGAIDASNIFKPSLARGKMRCIGATTIDEYKKYIEKDGALDRRFQKLEIKEPNDCEIKNILMNLKDIYSKHHNVLVNDKIINKIIFYSKNFIKCRKEPDRSIDILDEVCSKVALKNNKKEKNILKLKSKLSTVIKSKEILISNNKFKEAYKLKKSEDKMNSILNKLEIENANIIKSVSENDILEVIKSKVNIPILNIDDNYLNYIKNCITKRIVGNTNAINEILKMCKVFNRNYDCLSLLLCGNKGLGKCSVAKLFAELLVGKDNIIYLDTSSMYSVNAINNSGIFNEIKNKSRVVIILDDIEKCNNDILNLFIDGLKNGSFKDYSGNDISLKNVIIIMIANIDISNKSFGFSDKSNDKYYYLNRKFGRDFIGSITKIIQFDNLNEKERIMVVDKYLNKLEDKYKVKIILSLEIKNKIVESINYEGDTTKNIYKIIRESIEPIIIDKLSAGNSVIHINSLNTVRVV
ncbi:MAG: ATP-dependent Clp protease ATP-binding subunit [Bacilli bacterium]|nr:ATP-dependent Clp protease ATP-binding subunit [Bacilli bacterium]